MNVLREVLADRKLRHLGIALLFQFVAYGLLISVDWRIALAFFLLSWSERIERKHG